MKLFIEGQAVEQEPGEVVVRPLFDRLMVETPEGTLSAAAIRSGDAVLISFRGRQFRVEMKQPRAAAHNPIGSGEIRAPMPGQIVDVFVTVGSELAKGDKILVLEAMKTQQAFASPFAGVVETLGVKKGDQVDDGTLLVVVSPNESP